MTVAQNTKANKAWQVVARSSDLQEGTVIDVKINRFRLALYRIDGIVYATSNICTHEFALLSDGYLDGDCIECPLHQASFHVPTGEVRSPPATEPILTYPTKEEADNILVELPE
jgi:nitrite reductase/ring-hydroxylating ferredoxin subunit